MTCARGSSDHAATFAKLPDRDAAGRDDRLRRRPRSARSTTPRRRWQGALCLAISQSGKSPDLLAAVEAATAAGALVVALVNDRALAARRPGRRRSCRCCAGPELSVAATKSYIAALAAIAAAGRPIGPRTPTLLDALDGAARPAATRPGRSTGAPRSTPLAAAQQPLRHRSRRRLRRSPQEAALKFKETCGLHAEAFSAAEVRHGPMALVGPGFPVLAVRAGRRDPPGVEAALAADLAGRRRDGDQGRRRRAAPAA